MSTEAPDLTAPQKKSAAAIIATQTCTRIGDVLTNPKTVLTWLLSQLGTSGFFIGMLVPIRESGSMLPQLFISGWVKRIRRRKWVVVGSAMAQAACIASMGLAALLLPPGPAGFVVLIALATFSLARAFSSISSKDVLGRAIPKGFRGRVSGVSTTLSGILSAIAAALLILYRDHETTTLLAWVVLGAAILWFLGAGLYSLVHEPLPEEQASQEPLFLDIGSRIRMVMRDPLFRRYIIARGLLLGSALASPLIVVLAQVKAGSLLALVGFLFAAAIATASSSFFWGKLADRASHKTMAYGGAVSALVGSIAIIIALWLPVIAQQVFIWPLLFLLFNLGYTGVRLGRKIWVVDAVDGDKRTDYVSASNTLIACIIIVMGLVTSPLQSISPLLPLSIYTLLCIAGTCVALTLGHAHEEQQSSP